MGRGSEDRMSRGRQEIHFATSAFAPSPRRRGRCKFTFSSLGSILE